MKVLTKISRIETFSHWVGERFRRSKVSVLRAESRVRAGINEQNLDKFKDKIKKDASQKKWFCMIKIFLNEKLIAIK